VGAWVCGCVGVCVCVGGIERGVQVEGVIIFWVGRVASKSTAGGVGGSQRGYPSTTPGYPPH